MLAASGRVWPAADGLPVEKRGVFFGRLVAQLLLRGSSFTTAGLEGVVRGRLGPDPTVGCQSGGQ